MAPLASFDSALWLACHLSKIRRAVPTKAPDRWGGQALARRPAALFRAGCAIQPNLKRNIIRPRHKPRDNLFRSSLFKLDIQLVAFDPHDRAVSELLVEHPLAHSE